MKTGTFKFFLETDAFAFSKLAEIAKKIFSRSIPFLFIFLLLTITNTSYAQDSTAAASDTVSVMAGSSAATEVASLPQKAQRLKRLLPCCHRQWQI